MTRLVDRIDELLERERAGIADLSHRLRTPLTAIRLRVEQLDPEQARRMAGDLDELETMVDHVVRESRRSDREGLVAATAVVDVVADRVGFWEALAEEQGRSLVLEVTAPADTLVRSSEEDLAALVDVLLDNVFSHTPEGTAIRVALAARDGGGATLVVDDAGPGFPDGVDVTDRGTSGAGSTGLGLAIAARTASGSGGSLRTEASDAGGGRVRVELGPPA